MDDKNHSPDTRHHIAETATDESPTSGGTAHGYAGSNENTNPYEEPSKLHLVFILGGLWVGVLLVSLGDTMLATISASVASSFGSFLQLSWITATFFIASTVSVPLSGHLTDIYGRRKGLVLCYTLFAIGTLACGLSEHRLWLFLTGRVIQGLGGGALCSITSFIESDIVPLQKRALIEGLGNIAYGATLALGGVYGGAINDSIGWKWGFLIQVPVIVLDAIWVITVVKVGREQPSSTMQASIDWLGCGLIVLTIVFFQLGLTIGSTGVWNTPFVIATLAVSSIGFTALIYWELARASNPVIPLRIMRQRTIASSQLSFFFASAASLAIMFYVPIYLEVLGSTTGQSGLRFIPYAVAFATGSFAAGFLVNHMGRYYAINIFVQSASVLGGILLCTISRDTPTWALFIYLFVLGLGLGGGYVTRLMGVLSSVNDDTQAIVQAASWTVESTGGSVGLAAGSAVFQKLSSSRLQVILREEPDVLSQLQGSFDILLVLDQSQREAVVDVYIKAVQGVLFLASGCLILAAIISLFMKNNKISDEPAAVVDRD
ncbi:multidrug resistance protein fnx1 [Xylariales sp. PMI_506]|nr:multidrug resistance protein fnx1 [Xylariales sp. PMI_506]